MIFNKERNRTLGSFRRDLEAPDCMRYAHTRVDQGLCIPTADLRIGGVVQEEVAHHRQAGLCRFLNQATAVEVPGLVQQGAPAEVGQRGGAGVELDVGARDVALPDKRSVLSKCEEASEAKSGKKGDCSSPFLFCLQVAQELTRRVQLAAKPACGAHFGTSQAEVNTAASWYHARLPTLRSSSEQVNKGRPSKPACHSIAGTNGDSKVNELSAWHRRPGHSRHHV
jgi:hypothetical protein